MRCQVGGDARGGVRAIDCTIEHGPLVAVERRRPAAQRVRAAQHDFQQTEQRGHALGQWVLLGSRVAGILGKQRRNARWQVEGIELVGRRGRKTHDLPTNCFGQRPYSSSGSTTMQSVPLTSCRSASSLQKKLLPAPAGATTTWLALSSDRSNGSSSTGACARARHPGEHAAFHRQRRPDEGQVAARALVSRLRGTSKRVLSLGQATEEAPLLLPERAARMRQQRVELLLHSPCELVELAQRPGAQQHVQADREQALLAALQSLAQPFGVLERDLALRICHALAAQRGQT